MNVAIHLDDQRFFVAIEIDNTVTDGMLPQKLEIIQLAVTERLPEEFLGFSLSLAQLTGSPLQRLDPVMLLELTSGLVWVVIC